jgi:hypothetical protein
MARKLLFLVLPLSAAVFVAAQWREIVRYLKIEMMSFGDGHPEVVPAEGQHGYPDPGRGAADGAAEFDAASRGGPA